MVNIVRKKVKNGEKLWNTQKHCEALTKCEIFLDLERLRFRELRGVNRLQTHRHTDRRTLQLIDWIGPVGRFSENINKLENVFWVNIRYNFIYFFILKTKCLSVWERANFADRADREYPQLQNWNWRSDISYWILEQMYICCWILEKKIFRPSVHLFILCLSGWDQPQTTLKWCRIETFDWRLNFFFLNCKIGYKMCVDFFFSFGCEGITLYFCVFLSVVKKYFHSFLGEL